MLGSLGGSWLVLIIVTDCWWMISGGDGRGWSPIFVAAIINDHPHRLVVSRSGHLWSCMTVAIAQNEYMAMYWWATSLFKVLILYESFVHLWTQDTWTCFEHWHSVIPNPALLLIFKSQTPQDSPWAVDKQTLQKAGVTILCHGCSPRGRSKAVAAYPGLCETFFPQGLEAGLERRVIRSSHKLLRSSYWDVLKP